MTLDEFMVQARAELDTFETDWRLRHEDSPDQYPVELDESEWWEMLMTWES